MKAILYVFIFFLMGANFTSCTPNSLTEATETIATEGEDGEIGGDDDDDGTGNN